MLLNLASLLNYNDERYERHVSKFVCFFVYQTSTQVKTFINDTVSTVLAYRKFTLIQKHSIIAMRIYTNVTLVKHKQLSFQLAKSYDPTWMA